MELSVTRVKNLRAIPDLKMLHPSPNREKGRAMLKVYLRQREDVVDLPDQRLLKQSERENAQHIRRSAPF
jgi:hypothetical protein